MLNPTDAAFDPVTRATMRETSARLGEWLSLAAVYAVLVVVTSIWVALDRRPPEWDYANHLERAVHCADDMTRGDVSTLLARSSFYPPLVPCAAGALYRLLPTDHAFAQAVMLAFLGLGMVATYALARRVAGGPGAVVAAALLATAPFVVHMTLRFQLDLPLAAMVAAFLAALLACEEFRRAGWALAAGLVFGLGMLTKPPFAVYVLPPLLLMLGRTRGRRAWLRALAAGILAVIVALPWYGPRLIGMPVQISRRSFRQAEEAGHPDPFSVTGLNYYPLHLLEQFGLVAALLLVVGLVVALRRRQWFLLAGLAPFLVFLLLRNKNLRYTLPLLPMAAAAAGLGFAALGRRTRWVAALALIVAAGVQVSSSAFGVPAALSVPVVGLPLSIPSPPASADWGHRAILALIARDAGGQPVTVSVVPNNAWFSAANFRYYAVRDQLPITIARAWDGEPIGLQYMILKTGKIGPSYATAKALRAANRLVVDRYLAEIFPVIADVSLPDGSMATVRARRVPAVDAQPARLAQALEAGFRRSLEAIALDVDGLAIRVDHDDAIRAGHVRRLQVSARAATVGELQKPGAARIRLRDVRVALDDVLVNPLSALAEQRFDPLQVGGLRIEGLRIDAAEFQDFLRQTKEGRSATVAFGPGFADVHVAMPGPDIQARIRLAPAADRPFAVHADRVRLGGLVVPDRLIDWVMRSVDPSAGIARRVPFRVDLAQVELDPGGVRVGTP